jgi:SAM-dependent methyltransferase
MAEYDDFAWFYDRYWNEEFHSLAFPILERIWLPRLAGNVGAHIVDVCCGTGYLAGLLNGMGYRVTGFDLSAQMVDLARRNAPDAEFHVGDAACCRLPGPFDAAVSTFDSLNHILGLGDLEAAFRNTADSLRAGAPFAFDMLLEDAYQTRWGEGFAIVRDDHVLTITGSGYDFRSRLATCTITMFRLIEGAWRRLDVTVKERCYRPAEIDRALARAGFGEVCCYDARDLGMAGGLGEGRTFYVAVKA